MNGVIHSRPQNAEEYQKISFAAYDLKLSIAASLYGAEERTPMEVIRAKLESSNWTDTNALRRMMEYYKDLAFPAASLVFCILGVPVGTVSKRSGSIGRFAVGVLVVTGSTVIFHWDDDTDGHAAIRRSISAHVRWSSDVAGSYLIGCDLISDTRYALSGIDVDEQIRRIRGAQIDWSRLLTREVASAQ